MNRRARGPAALEFLQIRLGGRRYGKRRNADTDPDQLQRIIDETVSEVRAQRYAKGKADRFDKT
jgi:hypothetical protein